MSNTSLIIILLAALALTIIVVSAVSGISSLQQAKATSLVHLSLCRHNPLSERVNLFRQHLQTLQIMVTCLT
jgi:hypothetical protein